MTKITDTKPRPATEALDAQGVLQPGDEGYPRGPVWQHLYERPTPIDVTEARRAAAIDVP
jgi:hypothetical protein